MNARASQAARGKCRISPSQIPRRKADESQRRGKDLTDNVH